MKWWPSGDAGGGQNVKIFRKSRRISVYRLITYSRSICSNRAKRDTETSKHLLNSEREHERNTPGISALARWRQRRPTSDPPSSNEFRRYFAAKATLDRMTIVSIPHPETRPTNACDPKRITQHEVRGWRESELKNGRHFFHLSYPTMYTRYRYENLRYLVYSAE